MKRSSHITLGLLAGMALAFTSGCHRNERRDCVDESNRITSDANCVAAEDDRRRGLTPPHYYRYVYGGSSGGNIGDQVFNGNPMPGMGSSVGGVSRGGFGASGEAGGHGGSGGE